MLFSGSIDIEITEGTEGTLRSFQEIRSKIQFFLDNLKAPHNGVGRKRSITPSILNACCEHLLESQFYINLRRRINRIQILDGGLE